MSTIYVCADCPKQISWGGARCRSCAAIHRNKSPELRAKMREATKRVQASRPELLDQLREMGRAKLLELHAARVAAGLPHPRKGVRKFPCPPERQAEFEHLRKRMGAEEARRIMTEDMAVDRNRSARAAVERAQRAMQEKHQRELASRY